MTLPAERPANCGACAFWHKLREHDGLCCRHAPAPSDRPNEVSHWCQTRISQWCGEGVAAPPFSIGSYCATCLYWRRPEQGLMPLDRGDLPMAWWYRAGICTRHAPHPVAEPGPRAFWRATLDTDFCAEGEPRHAAPARWQTEDANSS